VAFIEEQGVVDVDGWPEVISESIYDEPRSVSPAGTETYLEPIRDLPSIPVECDTLPKNYRNEDDNTAADEVFSNNDYLEVDTGNSSNVDLSSETPYNMLETSTREPLPDPSVYNSLTKPEYCNANIEAIEMMNDIVDNEAQSGSGMPLNGSAASQV